MAQFTLDKIHFEADNSNLGKLGSKTVKFGIYDNYDFSEEAIEANDGKILPFINAVEIDWNNAYLPHASNITMFDTNIGNGLGVYVNTSGKLLSIVDSMAADVLQLVQNNNTMSGNIETIRSNFSLENTNYATLSDFINSTNTNFDEVKGAIQTSNRNFQKLQDELGIEMESVQANITRFDGELVKVNEDIDDINEINSDLRKDLTEIQNRTQALESGDALSSAVQKALEDFDFDVDTTITKEKYPEIFTELEKDKIRLQNQYRSFVEQNITEKYGINISQISTVCNTIAKAIEDGALTYSEYTDIKSEVAQLDSFWMIIKESDETNKKLEEFVTADKLTEAIESINSITAGPISEDVKQSITTTINNLKSSINSGIKDATLKTQLLEQVNTFESYCNTAMNDGVFTDGEIRIIKMLASNLQQTVNSLIAQAKQISSSASDLSTISDLLQTGPVTAEQINEVRVLIARLKTDAAQLSSDSLNTLITNFETEFNEAISDSTLTQYELNNLRLKANNIEQLIDALVDQKAAFANTYASKSDITGLNVNDINDSLAKLNAALSSVDTIDESKVNELIPYINTIYFYSVAQDNDLYQAIGIQSKLSNFLHAADGVQQISCIKKIDKSKATAGQKTYITSQVLDSKYCTQVYVSNVQYYTDENKTTPSSTKTNYTNITLTPEIFDIWVTRINSLITSIAAYEDLYKRSTDNLTSSLEQLRQDYNTQLEELGIGEITYDEYVILIGLVNDTGKALIERGFEGITTMTQLTQSEWNALKNK